MIISLYMMTVCFCAYDILPEKVRLVAMSLGVLFFWIANICYDRTITKFKDEIIDLNKKIDNLKE